MGLDKLLGIGLKLRWIEEGLSNGELLEFEVCDEEGNLYKIISKLV